MNTYIDAKTLKDTLKRIKPFTDSKPHIPILEYVKLESQDGYLSITAVNGERFGNEPSFITFKGFTAFSPEYSILVKFADLRKVINKLKGEVELSASENTLHIKTDKLSFTLKGKPATDFPECISERGDFNASSAPTFGDLRDELDFVYRATNEENRRNYTNAVMFDYTKPDRLRMIGTDGRRLHSSFTATRMHSCGKETTQYLLPMEWVKAFCGLKLATDADVFLEFYGEDQLWWRIPDEGIHGVVKCMDTPFPDYEKVIPTDCESRFKLDTKATIESLNALSVIATQRDGRDMIVVKANGTLNLSAASEQMGTAKAEVACTHLSGPEATFALNVFFFTETLKLANGEITMSNSGSLEPARFDYPDTERVAVVMPVRLPE